VAISFTILGEQVMVIIFDKLSKNPNNNGNITNDFRIIINEMKTKLLSDH